MRSTDPTAERSALATELTTGMRVEKSLAQTQSPRPTYPPRRRNSSAGKPPPRSARSNHLRARASSSARAGLAGDPAPTRHPNAANSTVLCGSGNCPSGWRSSAADTVGLEFAAMLSGYGARRCYSSGTPPSSPVRATKSPHLQRIYLPRVVPDAATPLVTKHRRSERLGSRAPPNPSSRFSERPSVVAARRLAVGTVIPFIGLHHTAIPLHAMIAAHY